MAQVEKRSSKFTRENQRSVYLDSDVREQLRDFANTYPLLPFSMIVNAAMRCYFRHAKDGIDGNLQPLSDK